MSRRETTADTEGWQAEPEDVRPVDADDAVAPDDVDAVGASPLLSLDHGGFWFGSLHSSLTFVPLTPMPELSAPALRTLREWLR